MKLTEEALQLTIDAAKKMEDMPRCENWASDMSSLMASAAELVRCIEDSRARHLPLTVDASGLQVGAGIQRPDGTIVYSFGPASGAVGDELTRLAAIVDACARECPEDDTMEVNERVACEIARLKASEAKAWGIIDAAYEGNRLADAAPAARWRAAASDWRATYFASRATSDDRSI